jgi:hypothetical protein
MISMWRDLLAFNATHQAAQGACRKDVGIAE